MQKRTLKKSHKMLVHKPYSTLCENFKGLGLKLIFVSIKFFEIPHLWNSKHLVDVASWFVCCRCFELFFSPLPFCISVPGRLLVDSTAVHSLMHGYHFDKKKKWKLYFSTPAEARRVVKCVIVQIDVLRLALAGALNSTTLCRWQHLHTLDSNLAFCCPANRNIILSVSWCLIWFSLLLWFTQPARSTLSARVCLIDILLTKYVPGIKVQIVFVPFFYPSRLFSPEKQAWLITNSRRPTTRLSKNPTEGAKQSHKSAWEVCSSWLFWVSLCSSRLVSHGWPQRCLESLRRGRRGSVSEFTVAACHRTPSLTYSSKWIGWDCVAACAEPRCPSTLFLYTKRSSFVLLVFFACLSIII